MKLKRIKQFYNQNQSHYSPSIFQKKMNEKKEGKEEKDPNLERIRYLGEFLNSDLIKKRNNDSLIDYPMFLSYICTPKNSNTPESPLNLFTNAFFLESSLIAIFFREWASEPSYAIFLEVIENAFQNKKEDPEEIFTLLLEFYTHNQLGEPLIFEQKEQGANKMDFVSQLKEMIRQCKEKNYFKDKQLLGLFNAFFTYFPHYHKALSDNERALFKPLEIDHLWLRIEPDIFQEEKNLNDDRALQNQLPARLPPILESKGTPEEKINELIDALQTKKTHVLQEYAHTDTDEFSKIREKLILLTEYSKKIKPLLASYLNLPPDIPSSKQLKLAGYSLTLILKLGSSFYPDKSFNGAQCLFQLMDACMKEKEPGEPIVVKILPELIPFIIEQKKSQEFIARALEMITSANRPARDMGHAILRSEMLVQHAGAEEKVINALLNQLQNNNVLIQKEALETLILLKESIVKKLNKAEEVIDHAMSLTVIQNEPLLLSALDALYQFKEVITQNDIANEKIIARLLEMLDASPTEAVKKKIYEVIKPFLMQKIKHDTIDEAVPFLYGTLAQHYAQNQSREFATLMRQLHDHHYQLAIAKKALDHLPKEIGLIVGKFVR